MNEERSKEMKTCKDCLHYLHCAGLTWERVRECRNFTPRNEWVHLPCKVGDRVFSIVIIGGEYSVVAERVHALKISTEKIYAETYWYDSGEIGYNVFLTQEEAEKALAER